MRRLTGDEHLDPRVRNELSTYELDDKTRALLTYVTKLTGSPRMLAAADFGALRAAGWGRGRIWEATALASWFNFTGRMEPPRLPPDRIAADAHPAEVRA
ncbi:MAG: hypothetical protein M3N24_09925 [Actinomycetota bacterium]|nr:hypothetical protein [Actinomycetota bacterium]